MMKRISLSLSIVFAFSLCSYGSTVYRNSIQTSPYNLIFTKVLINNREVLALIDSGSFRTVQVASTLSQDLGLPLIETSRIAKRYEGKDLYIKTGKVNSFRLGNFQKQNMEIDVIDGDIENISRQVNTNFSVILGWGFLSQFYSLIDYANHSMAFGDSPLTGEKEKLSIDYAIVNGVPVIKGSLAGREINLLLDTGAPMCNIDPEIANAGKETKTNKEIEIGNFKTNLEWRVKDLSPIKRSLNALAVIGNNFLSKYAVYFDPTKKTVVLY